MVDFAQSDIKLALILRSYTAPLAIASKILIEKRENHCQVQN